MQRHQILTGDFRVAELMYVGHVRSRHVADVPLACRLIVKLSLIIQSEHGLPHHAFADAHCAVRAVVVVDGRALSGTPAENESFQDRKSTRLNSSHRTISYAVFCLKKK